MLSQQAYAGPCQPGLKGEGQSTHLSRGARGHFCHKYLKGQIFKWCLEQHRVQRAQRWLIGPGCICMCCTSKRHGTQLHPQIRELPGSSHTVKNEFALNSDLNKKDKLHQYANEAHVPSAQDGKLFCM